MKRVTVAIFAFVMGLAVTALTTILTQRRGLLTVGLHQSILLQSYLRFFEDEKASDLFFSEFAA